MMDIEIEVEFSQLEQEMDVEFEQSDMAMEADFGELQTVNIGLSAYQVAVKNGFEGTEEEWLESLKGDKGDTGPAGPAGPQGPKGDTGPAGADGISPVVAVEDIDGGHRVTITDKNGAKQFDVMDGKDGEGGSAEGLGALAYKDKVGYGDLDDNFRSIVDDRVTPDEWAAAMNDLDNRKPDVHFEQNFTEAEKAMARKNMGAVSLEEVLAALPVYDGEVVTE